MERPAHDVPLALGLAAGSDVDCDDRHGFTSGGEVSLMFADFASR
jgi:hypothetical protein